MAEWPFTFREAFCRCYHCAPEEFVVRATRKALPWRVRLLRPLIQFFRPDHFKPDYEFLERVGTARDWKEVHSALGAFESSNRLRGGFYRTRLKFRASGRRVTALVQRVLEETLPNARH
jgi:hypothetical protein